MTETEKYLKTYYHAKWDEESPVRIKYFTRGRLARLFSHLKLLKGAEIGTRDGKFAKEICVINPDLELICVDAWQDYPELDCKNTQDKQDWHYRMAQSYLKGNKVTFMREFSMDAVKKIPENSLDFVYIDANHHYKFIKEDIEEWSKRVKIGGIISGHDYGDLGNCDVKQVVDEYTKINNITRWFISGETAASYFWVK